MYERILIRYGDLTLKGKNKKVFIDRVNNLIKNKVNNENVTYERNHDRMYILLMVNVIQQLNLKVIFCGFCLKDQA